MLKFKDLTSAQKASVLAAIAHEPALSVSGEVEAKEIKRVFGEMVEKRASGGPVVAYPVWLSKFNNVRRGVQMWPAPTEDDLVYLAKAEADNVRVERIKAERKEKAVAAKRTPKEAGLVDVKPKAVSVAKPKASVEVVKERKSLQDIIPESTAYDDMADDDFAAILEANGIHF
jgi:hypothetical protein